uniref:CCHC-type domain-containing protein n=1 Tax=Echeneis naucrates TaxID=173247 RepID=A0A665TME7_ECHNA
MLLVNGCKGESVDLRYALLIYGVPEGVEKEEIEETAETITALGKVVVRGKMFHPQQQLLMVLCECCEVVNPSKIPPVIMPISGRSGWKAVYYTEPQLNGFEEKLLAFLQNERKTIEDILGLCTSRGETSDPEDIIRAVGDMMRTNKPPNSHSYRHLRTISGVSPTTIGEESLDNWLENKGRILESLRRPAMKIIQAVCMTQPDASPHDYIEAIKSIFGTAEPGEELYLSLARSLVKVVLRGGLAISDANKARVGQLIKGSTSDLMFLQLIIREQREKSPTFLNLLQEVIDKETHQSVRQSQATAMCHQCCGKSGHIATRCRSQRIHRKS